MPVSTIEDYRATAPWSEFKEIVALTDEELNPASIVITNADILLYPIDYFNMAGKRIPKPQRGLTITRMSDGTIKKIFIK